jgi:hypothetical protein
MIKRQLSNYRDRISRYLLRAILLFGILGYSGYRAPQSQSAITSISTNHQQFPHKRAICYRKAITLATNTNITYNARNVQIAFALLACHTLTRVKLIALSKQIYSLPLSHRYIHLKTIPQSSPEDISISNI